jgi:Kelch motif
MRAARKWRPDAPARRLETAAGALGTRLVIAGGFSASMTEGLPITTEVLTFDTLLGEWDSLPAAPVAWTHANVAAVGGAVYLLGGLDGRSFIAQPEAFVLEADAAEWTPLDPLPEARGGAAVVVSKGHIFLLGGASTSGALKTSLDFDLGTRTWSRMPVDLPTARSHAAAMRRYDDGAFVIAGGLGDLSSGRPLGDVYTLTPDATNWALAEPMPTSRGGCAYGVTFGNLICAGGEAGLVALDVVEIYNPILNTWSTAEPIPEPRAGARGTVVSNRLYIPGGSMTLDFEPTDSLFVFAPLAP